MKTTLDLQNKLLSLGFDIGTADGFVGPMTGNALSTAILSKKISLVDETLKAFKFDCRETPNRITLESVYGVVKYKEGSKGRITILNPEAWQKHFCQIEVCGIEVSLHKKIACQVLGAFAEIEIVNQTLPVDQQWHPSVIQAYCPRHNMWDAKRPLSTHTWAIAIDIDPKQNAVSDTKLGNIPEWVIEILESWGATWGGRWRQFKDPMHFQWMR